MNTVETSRVAEGSGPLEVIVDHLKITCTKEGVTLDDAVPF